MYILNDLWLADTQVIVAARETAKVLFYKVILLDHCSHASIEQKDSSCRFDGFGQGGRGNGKGITLNEIAL